MTESTYSFAIHGFSYRTVQRDWDYGFDYPATITHRQLKQRQCIDHERYGYCAAWHPRDSYCNECQTREAKNV